MYFWIFEFLGIGCVLGVMFIDWRLGLCIVGFFIYMIYTIQSVKDTIVEKMKEDMRKKKLAEFK
jgi:hypothetical protein